MTAEPMTPETFELFGAIVAQNVADATHTTNMLLATKDQQIRDLAEALVAIGRVLDAATVIDRKTERRLRDLYVHIDSAEFLLQRLEDGA
ncbi:hypothetical protein ACFJIY_07555 [Pimelobacter simplex]|uniref:hypothetical protein n=1 Tax=Nocardioides simplex TaxID=2045 RepID=UPI003672A84D